MIRGRSLAALAPLAVSFCACQQMNTPLYFAPEMSPLTLPVMSDHKPVRMENGLALRFRNPTDAEQKSLDQQASALGFAVPWIQRGHVHLELIYQVTNKEAAAPANSGDVASFAIAIDGANEYTKYDENIVAQALQQGNNDQPTYVPLISVTPQTIAPGQTISGIVREDDFAEAELDLDAIGRWSAPFEAVLINNSQVNPIGLEMVPANAVIPALIEVDVNFTANRLMTLTYDIRVRDDDGQLLHVASDTLFSPTPALFQPPAMTP
ncbi:MAG: hypothetical protein ACJ8F1_06705 [Polyangia bacterium]